MAAVIDALRAEGGPLTFGDIAIAVYGSRTVTRLRGSRHFRVKVPDGDPSNLRRAISSLVRTGTILEVEADVSEPGRGKAQIRYGLSDRFMCNGSRRREVETPTPAVAGFNATPHGVSSLSPSSFATDCASTQEAAEESRIGDEANVDLEERVSAPCELTDEERAFLDVLADTAVAVLEEQLAQGQAPDLGFPPPASNSGPGRNET